MLLWTEHVNIRGNVFWKLKLTLCLHCLEQLQVHNFSVDFSASHFPVFICWLYQYFFYFLLNIEVELRMGLWSTFWAVGGRRKSTLCLIIIHYHGILMANTWLLVILYKKLLVNTDIRDERICWILTTNF